MSKKEAETMEEAHEEKAKSSKKEEPDRKALAIQRATKSELRDLIVAKEKELLATATVEELEAEAKRRGPVDDRGLPL